MLVIVLPDDEVRVRQLRSKLKEYWDRLNNSTLLKHRRNTLYKIAVLDKLLRDGRVDTDELREELLDNEPFTLDSRKFSNVCYVIEDYCLIGGKRVFGGTGLK